MKNMRSKFPGHFRLPDREVKKLWATALFVFDANVLLNFYRYSDGTRRDFVALLKKLTPRLWLPHQACGEFLRNRLNTIAEQEREYGDAVSDLAKLEEKFRNDRKHPFLPRDLGARVAKIFDEVRAHLNAEKNRFDALTTDDPVLKEIEELFGENIGEPPTEESLAQIYKNGAERYKKRIPPGFKDAGKADEAGDERKYGDLVLWTEMMEKCRAEKLGMIFVTDDRKEDWWSISGSKTIGPRSELISEFRAKTGQQTMFYLPHRFLEFAQRFLGEAIPDAVIAETKARKDVTGSASVDKLTGSVWFDRVTELDRLVATLGREIVAAERDFATMQQIHDLVGGDKSADDLRIAETNLTTKKHQLIQAQSELKAISAHR